MPKTVYTTILVGTLLAVSLVGCASKTGTAAPQASTGINRPAATPAPTAARTPATTEPAADVNPKFGEEYVWEDGVTVTISAPKAFNPSKNAISEDSAAYVAFDATVVNGSSKNFDPSSMYTTLQSANVEESEVFDSANGFEGPPDTPLLPGREVVFKIGYGATDPKDLVMSVRPSFDHKAALFTS